MRVQMFLLVASLFSATVQADTLSAKSSYAVSGSASERSNSGLLEPDPLWTSPG